MPRFGDGAVPATDGMVMLPAAELYQLAMLLQHEGEAPHAEARRLASDLCLRHLPTHDGRERAPLQGSLRGSVAPPPPELVTQLETRAAFELLESAPGLVRQYTLRRALLAPSLSHRPLAAHQVGALLHHVGVDERGLVSLERFNQRLSVLPAIADPAPPPSHCSRCVGLFRRGKRKRLQYQEQPGTSPASDFSGDESRA